MELKNFDQIAKVEEKAEQEKQNALNKVNEIKKISKIETKNLVDDLIRKAKEEKLVKILKIEDEVKGLEQIGKNLGEQEAKTIICLASKNEDNAINAMINLIENN